MAYIHKRKVVDIILNIARLFESMAAVQTAAVLQLLTRTVGETQERAAQPGLAEGLVAGLAGSSPASNHASAKHEIWA